MTVPPKRKSFIFLEINLSLTLVMNGVLHVLCPYCHLDSVILKQIAFASEGSTTTISYL